MKLFFDIEATGLPETIAYGKWYPPELIQKYDTSRVIEIGIILVKNGKTIETYNSIIKPDNFTKLDKKITELTGITDDMIMNEGKDMKKDKETMKEDMHITTDSPEEAGMLMQILKMAGLKPVDAKMMGMEPKQDMDHGHDDAMGTMQMAKMRDMMTAPEQEKAEETFANEPEEKVQDVDSLVNKHSGGLNRQKSSFSRAEPGDNPMTAEDKITEQALADSLRTQYENFKETYQKAAETKAKPDFLDMDKDGNKTEPMKKAVKDKEEKEAK